MADTPAHPQFDPFAPGSAAPSVEASRHAGQARPRGITIKAPDEKGQKTAHKVIEAMKNVIDPELGIDVVDLGLLYGVEIDDQGRAILTMTLTTPACPLTDLLEDGAAVALAPVVDYFRVDWVWDPVWDLSMITPQGRQMLNAIGYDF
jgi:metal-sulfur cluster biosynthetic enzyme